MMTTKKFDETELRLGLPGGGAGESEAAVVAAAAVKTNTGAAGGKRGFSETVDLKLNLSPKEQVEENKITVAKEDEKNFLNAAAADSVKPPAKAQVVGWPPVRSYRKNNILATKKSSTAAEEMSGTKDKMMSGGGNGCTGATNGGNAQLVKVSMDGAPYLRKVDLKMYKSYQQLSDALGKMFSSFTIGNYGSQGMIDFMNESKLMDVLSGSDYVPTYEDKDGDWMLVGDVPWEMFVVSCNRLRIMKGKEAAGLAPRAMEKCKNRS